MTVRGSWVTGRLMRFTAHGSISWMVVTKSGPLSALHCRIAALTVGYSLVWAPGRDRARRIW